ncbi:hypothetical protein HanXRQr2_Chr03g0137761 [Helianthus annuus]|uniref:Uncharacterized protein n=1 Tax=Helianthus annuus TaxID=4232 RepID=A0A9K3NYI6_HELAN|nr:hypothetical protein HanXRQr2_Chr03g0137761 [Helianthus annuus]KAJ0946000.1 hypothetical protein HanPSC8_Chr03g0134331 [Helianthus annuus]
MIMAEHKSLNCLFRTSMASSLIHHYIYSNFVTSKLKRERGANAAEVGLLLKITRTCHILLPHSHNITTIKHTLPISSNPSFFNETILVIHGGGDVEDHGGGVADLSDG